MITRIGIQILGWLLLALLAIGESKAQQVNLYCNTGTGITAWQPASAANPCPVAASATISGFTAATLGTPITADTNGETGTLPAGTVVVATNTGSVAAYCQLGGSSSTNGQYIAPGGGWFAFTVLANTQITCTTASSTAVINLVGGAGLPTGTGGGGGSGGGAVTLASGAVSSGAYSSGSIASGAFASGSVASGAFASGALASGSIAAGAQVDLLTMRGTKAPGTAAANSALVGALYDATAVTLTDGQQAALQSDSNGNLKGALGIATTTLSGWTSGTSLNATQVLMVNHGAPAILLQLNQTSTISAGAITIQGTFDGTNWVTVPVAQVLNPNTFANLTNPYTLVASTNQPFLILTQGYQSVRINLTTQITGSATVTPFVTLLNYNPAIGALLNPLAAGSAIIGKVGVDQTTPGTTNGVAIVGVNAATALAGNGATGTGSQRVTVANDNTGIANWGHVATGAAPPLGSIAISLRGAGATGGQQAIPIACDNHVFKHITSATDTVAVQGVASQTIYICAWRSRAAGVATWYLENTASTNNNCSSTLTQLTGVATEAANTGETWGGAFWSGLKNTSGNGLCINSTGTGGVDIDIWYTQF